MKDFFRDENGKVIIAQKPNGALYVALIFFILRFIFPELKTVSVIGTSLAMLYWSYMEIADGVNKFRNLLGWVTGFYFLWNMFNLFS